MKGTILENIVAERRRQVERQKRSIDLRRLERAAAEALENRRAGLFRDAISGKARPNVIAEFKRASPSKGTINETSGPAETAAAFEDGGAAAVSVLTEETFFRGSMDDLAEVRRTVRLPILRKDFTVDEVQILESAAAGADAVLLIAAVLGRSELERLDRLARDLGLDAMIEVHNAAEMEIAVSIGASVIGVNNRDLKTFEVSLDTSRELIKLRPEGTVMVAESGINSAEEVRELWGLGFSAFLIGESLMRAGDPASKLREMTGRSV